MNIYIYTYRMTIVCFSFSSMNGNMMWYHAVYRNETHDEYHAPNIQTPQAYGPLNMCKFPLFKAWFLGVLNIRGIGFITYSWAWLNINYMFIIFTWLVVRTFYIWDNPSHWRTHFFKMVIAPPTSNYISSFPSSSYTKTILSLYHRIGWWEHLQESPIFDGKNHGFL